MAVLSVLIQRAHDQGTFGMNVESDLVVSDPFMRKVTNKVSGDSAAELPPELCSDGLYVSEEFLAGKVWVFVEVPFALSERLFHIILHFVLQRIVPDHKGTSEIRLPLLEDRAEIEEEDVVLANREIGRIVVVRQQGIFTSSN